MPKNAAHPRLAADRAEVADILDGLSAEQRRAVVTAVADNVLEGWDPTEAEIRLLADRAAGKITAEEYRCAVLAAAKV